MLIVFCLLFAIRAIHKREVQLDEDGLRDFCRDDVEIHGNVEVLYTSISYAFCEHIMKLPTISSQDLGLKDPEAVALNDFVNQAFEGSVHPLERINLQCQETKSFFCTVIERLSELIKDFPYFLAKFDFHGWVELSSAMDSSDQQSINEATRIILGDKKLKKIFEHNARIEY
eukprot:NODE_426_length_7665_cov_0.708961.p7 type:complete len:172 gc:universal NODE_426_length_7665_cov_0.708961:6153-5638(-)